MPDAGAHAVARFRGLGVFFLTRSWGLRPGFMLTPAPQANQLIAQAALGSIANARLARHSEGPRRTSPRRQRPKLSIRRRRRAPFQRSLESCWHARGLYRRHFVTRGS